MLFFLFNIILKKTEIYLAICNFYVNFVAENKNKYIIC